MLSPNFPTRDSFVTQYVLAGFQDGTIRFYQLKLYYDEIYDENEQDGENDKELVAIDFITKLEVKHFTSLPAAREFGFTCTF